MNTVETGRNLVHESYVFGNFRVDIFPYITELGEIRYKGFIICGASKYILSQCMGSATRDEARKELLDSFNRIMVYAKYVTDYLDCKFDPKDLKDS